MRNFTKQKLKNTKLKYHCQTKGRNTCNYVQFIENDNLQNEVKNASKIKFPMCSKIKILLIYTEQKKKGIILVV